ncbi:hypothetical protein [Propionibacterium freudenreichii]|uniref:phage tail tube protein n=1 Tax=Propionibacterium freudenreichii TaxID=1744 RepID=UPI002551349E|nr:hypothetical protein [Propionibacterium freudenreichii]MDK9627014.1 hypothetical protein [Propionibacterium freudenreichii]
MAITAFAPDDTMTSGNTVVNFMPAVKDIEKPTLEEWNAGFMVQCAIEGYKASTDAKTQERKKLCDRVATQSVGSRTYNLDNMTIVSDDPQADAPLPAILINDATIFVGVRPGLDHTDPAAGGQKVWIDKATIVAVDPAEINTDDGNAFGWVIQFAVKARSYKATIATAAPQG